MGLGVPKLTKLSPTFVVIGHDLFAAAELLILVSKSFILTAESGDHLLRLSQLASKLCDWQLLQRGA